MDVPAGFKPIERTSFGSYRLRPSKISGFLSLALMVSKSGLRNSFHSVTMTSASAASWDNSRWDSHRAVLPESSHGRDPESAASENESSPRVTPPESLVTPSTAMEYEVP